MRFVLVVVALLTLGVSGCQSARSVVPVDLGPADLVPPTDPRLLTTHDTAVRGIAAMLARDFGLPVPGRVTVYVYGSRRGFEEGLVHHAAPSPGRAAPPGEVSAGGGGRPPPPLLHHPPP